MDKKVIDQIISDSLPYSDSNGKNNGFSAMVETAALTPMLETQPPFLEIGTRKGGSALAVLKIIETYFDKKNTGLITVDPYGDMQYDNLRWKYGAPVYKAMKKLLAPYPNHIHYCMTSREFISIMDSISFWLNGKRQTFKQFSFIFLDGSHLSKNVLMEFEQLYPRLIDKGFIVVDNTDMYNGEVRTYLNKLFYPKKNINHVKEKTIIQKV